MPILCFIIYYITLMIDYLFFIRFNLAWKLMQDHLELKIIFKAADHMSILLPILKKIILPCFLFWSHERAQVTKYFFHFLCFYFKKNFL